VVANASCFVMHFTALNFIQYLLKYVKSKLKFPIGSPYKKSVQCNVWENAKFYGMLLSFPWVSMPYEAKESGSGQSGCTDFEYDISILIKRCFPVAHDENLSYKKV